MCPVLCRYANARKREQWLCVYCDPGEGPCESIGETVYHHAGGVMWALETSSLDDSGRVWWNPDMILCSSGQGIFTDEWPRRLER